MIDTVKHHQYSSVKKLTRFLEGSCLGKNHNRHKFEESRTEKREH